MGISLQNAAAGLATAVEDFQRVRPAFEASVAEEWAGVLNALRLVQSALASWPAGTAMASMPATPDKLFEALAHGSERHRAWLKAALEAIANGEPVPKADDDSSNRTAEACPVTERRPIARALIVHAPSNYRPGMSACGDIAPPYKAGDKVDCPACQEVYVLASKLGGAVERIRGEVDQ